jgi:predicted dinucleotide-binding enzyme
MTQGVKATFAASQIALPPPTLSSQNHHPLPWSTILFIGCINLGGSMKRSLTCIWLSSFVLLGSGEADQPAESAKLHRKDTVAVIGTGDMGDSFGPRLAALGYQVIYGSRNPASDKVTGLVAATGHGASATSQKRAAQQAEIVLLALPWPAMETVTQNLGNLEGKFLIDISYPPLDIAEDGYYEITVETSSAEMIQSWNPGAKVVKAFGTLGSNAIDDPSTLGGAVSVPIASDDRAAKEKVAILAAELGFDPIDAGPLRMARTIEAMQNLLAVPLLQRRDTSWNFYFRRSNYWNCNPYVTEEGVFEWPLAADSDNLADMPQTQGPPEPCP